MFLPSGQREPLLWRNTSMRMQPGYLPTSNQITEACLRIRQTWSTAEKRRRLVGYSDGRVENRWHPPQINLAGCTARVQKEMSELTY